MAIVGVSDAKIRLRELLQQVSRGETIRITVRGVPVAMLVPDNEDLADVAREIREIRKGARLGKISIRELIERGRR